MCHRFSCVSLAALSLLLSPVCCCVKCKTARAQPPARQTPQSQPGCFQGGKTNISPRATQHFYWGGRLMLSSKALLLFIYFLIRNLVSIAAVLRCATVVWFCPVMAERLLQTITAKFPDYTRWNILDRTCLFVYFHSSEGG